MSSRAARTMWKGRERFNLCVAVHELRQRMRGGRPFLMLFVSALAAAVPVLAAVALYALRNASAANEGRLGPPALIALAYSQLGLIALTVPAYAAGTIAVEREKQTLEMLRATLLSPGEVVTGKLGVVLAFGGLLLLTSMPVAAWSLLLGGVNVQNVAAVYFYLLSVLVVVSCLGLFISALCRYAVTAIAATYVLVVGWTGGLPALLYGWKELNQAAVRGPTEFMVANGIFLAIAGLTGLGLYRWLERHISAESTSRAAAQGRAAGFAVATTVGVFALLASPILDLLTATWLEWGAVLSPYSVLALMLDPGPGFPGLIVSPSPAWYGAVGISRSGGCLLGVAANLGAALIFWPGRASVRARRRRERKLKAAKGLPPATANRFVGETRPKGREP